MGEERERGVTGRGKREVGWGIEREGREGKGEEGSLANDCENP